MYFFFDILKVSSVIEPWNSHWQKRKLFTGNNRQKPGFFLVPAWLHFNLVLYCYEEKFRKTQSQQVKFFVAPDKKQYKTKFEITVISLFRLVNFNLEILLIRKTFVENDVIKWLPAFQQ